jgi:hypothetical protein
MDTPTGESTFWGWVRRTFGVGVVTPAPLVPVVTERKKEVVYSGRPPRMARRVDLSKKPVVKRPHGTRSRVTKEEQQENSFAGFGAIEDEPTPERDWRDYDLSDSTLDRISISDLVEILVDVSPEVARALWDFLRMMNPGWECQVFRPGTTTTDPRAKEVIDTYFQQLSNLYGAVDVVFSRLINGGFIRGGFLAEIVLDETGKTAVDFATPDPNVISFKKMEDKTRGEYWQLGQYQGGEFVPLDSYPTIRYIPVDPLPGNPFGRAIINPSIFLAVFAVGLLRDLRRVVAQQGYPRLDIEIKLETLKDSMPEDTKDDPEKFKNWVEDVIAEVSSVYESLKPDDAFTHTDTVKLNRPVGAIGGDAAFGSSIGVIMNALERGLTRALKSMPLLMGTTQSTSETQANREWEIHAQGIKAMQHLVEQMLEHLLGVVLQAAGVQGTVKFRFAELRASEELRDAQTLAMKLANALNMYLQGYASQDEASMYAIGKLADSSAPRSVTGQDPLLYQMPQPEEGRGKRNLYEMVRRPQPERGREPSLNGHANGAHH